MNVVERQRHTRVAVLLEQLQRVLEPMVGEPVGDVAEPQAHVTALRLEARRASGQSAATPAAGASDPAPASSPASSGIRPMIPVPTAFCSRAGVGSRIASTCARPTVAA